MTKKDDDLARINQVNQAYAKAEAVTAEEFSGATLHVWSSLYASQNPDLSDVIGALRSMFPSMSFHIAYSASTNELQNSPTVLTAAPSSFVIEGGKANLAARVQKAVDAEGKQDAHWPKVIQVQSFVKGFYACKHSGSQKEREALIKENGELNCRLKELRSALESKIRFLDR